jgi:6-phosphogluconolactonase (cycloisomerase 2 family)
MVAFKILAGGFAGFIATYIFDSDAGTLTLQAQNPTGTNPSWIALHPQDSSILYAVNEQTEGALQSFTVDDNGNLTLVDTVPTGGNGPTFTNPTLAGEVSAMNFGSPNCSIVATDPEDRTKFLKDSPVIPFPVDGGPSNPHMSLEVNGEILVPDLGADKIWRLVNDGAPGKFKVQGQIDIDAGAGPRHIAFHDGVLFTLHEKTSTLTAQLIPEAPNGTTLPLLANVSIIPEQTLNGTKFAAAEILISTPTEEFPDPLIYVSNRNIGATIDPAGDTIAIFRFNGNNSTTTPPDSTTPPDTSNPDTTDPDTTEPETADPVNDGSEGGAPGIPVNNQYRRKKIPLIDSKKRMLKRHHLLRRQDEPEPAPVLELIAQIPTGLQQIRSMAISTINGTDQFLVAGANTLGGVSVFERVDGGKDLKLVVNNKDLENRTSFVFLP